MGSFLTLSSAIKPFFSLLSASIFLFSRILTFALSIAHLAKPIAQADPEKDELPCFPVNSLEIHLHPESSRDEPRNK